MACTAYAEGTVDSHSPGLLHPVENLYAPSILFPSHISRPFLPGIPNSHSAGENKGRLA